jgi:hypothetical protein
MGSAQRTIGEKQRSRGRLGAAWIGWLLALAGLGIGIAAGSVIPGAWKAKDETGLLLSGLMVLCGLLALIAGGSRLGAAPARGADPEATPASAASDMGSAAQALPRLGEILVYKYHLITERDVQRALTRQREGPSRPLGEILVDMGQITWRDLARALEDQLSYGDPWRRK